MNGGRVTLKASVASLALVAGAALGGTGASAADLGGDCCADLEERIAELEATTARKGNRKVSLEISGHVNEELLFWDDGFESNAGIYTNDNSRTRFRFKGKAKIDKDLEAGYQIEIGVRSHNSKRFNQEDAAALGDSGLDIRDSYWYLKSKSFGGVSVGQQATATDGITEINQTQTSEFSKFSDVEDGGLGLRLRRTDGVLSSTEQTRRLIGIGGDQPGEGERRFNVVKYTTPEFQGFAVSAAWGEDDYWDVGLRYKGEFAGLKVAAGFGYGEITDGSADQTKTVCAAVDADLGTDTSCHQFGGSISVLHEASGLFVNFGAGQKTDDNIENTARFATSLLEPDEDQTFWAIQAGIEKKWLPYGKTTLYGEYYDYDGGSTSRRLGTAAAIDPLQPAAFGASRAGYFHSGLQSYGFGVAQGFDAAALTLYVTYRHYESELTVFDTAGGVAQPGLVDIPLEDLDVVTAGGIIKF